MMTARFSFSDILGQLAIFCGVGAVNTVISLIIILLLSELWGVHYILANIAGYACGLTSGFAMHKHVTFRSQHTTTALKKQALSFFLVFAAGYAVQMGLLLMFVEVFHLPNMLSQIAAWFSYVGIGFIGNKYFTFAGDKHG